MFGKNEIVGQRWFRNHPENVNKDKLLVTSLFTSLQGEGPYRGKPAIFVRLSKCSLACRFCDTFFDAGDWLTIDEIMQRMKDSVIQTLGKGDESLVPTYAKFWELDTDLDYDDIFDDRYNNIGLVITGGEPMLQDLLKDLCEKACETALGFVQIESNGILTQKLPQSVTVVVSPKCLEKHGKAVKYLQPNEESLKRASCLKFVMEAVEGSPYAEVPEWAFEWRRKTGREIFVTPMNMYNDLPQKAKNLRASGQNDISLETRSTVDEVISFWEKAEDGSTLLDMEANQINHEYAAKYAIQNGLTFQVQIHLLASLA